MLDRVKVEDLATELNVSAGMIEKEWHAVQVAVLALAPVPEKHDQSFVFGGGTSLSAAHGLIQRFSEDVDIRICSNNGQLASASQVQAFCANLSERLLSAGYELDPGECADYTEFSSSRRAFRYTALFDAVEPFRPFVKVDVSASSCFRPTSMKAVQSQLDRATNTSAGSVLCVCPLETAADKLSALTWRIRDGRAIREPHTMRHLYDVHALADLALQNGGLFTDMVLTNLSKDISRINNKNTKIKPIPTEILGSLETSLKNPQYRENYNKFVLAFSYGRRPSFDESVSSINRIVSRVCR